MSRDPQIVSFSPGRREVRGYDAKPDQRGEVLVRISYSGLKNSPMDEVSISLRQALRLQHMLATSIAGAYDLGAERSAS